MAKPFDDRVDENGFMIVKGARTIVSTIDAWFKGDEHTKKREPREKELTEYAKSILKFSETE